MGAIVRMIHRRNLDHHKKYISGCLRRGRHDICDLVRELPSFLEDNWHRAILDIHKNKRKEKNHDIGKSDSFASLAVDVTVSIQCNIHQEIPQR